MSKYNKSQIFSSAWALVKKEQITLSQALKQTWAIAKDEVLKNEWQTITCNSNLVRHSTGKAVLIKIPKTELCFWHPTKLIRFHGKNNYLIDIRFNGGFKFNCKRTSEKTYAVLEERTFNSTEIQQYFN